MSPGGGEEDHEPPSALKEDEKIKLVITSTLQTCKETHTISNAKLSAYLANDSIKCSMY